MIIYFVPIFFLVFLLIKEIEFDKRVYFILWGIITFIAAFRYNIGTDYVFYKDIFEWNSRGESKELVGHLYYYLSSIVVNIGGNYSWIIFLSAIFLSYSVYKIFSILVSKNKLYFALLIYLTCGMYFSSYNIFRQYLAISCLVIAIYFYKNKSLLLMTIMFILAVLFHSSAIIISVLFAFFMIFKSDRYIYKVLIVAYIISLPLIFIDIQKLFFIFSFALPDKYESYLINETLFLNRNKMAVLKLVVPNITVIWLFLRYNIVSKMNFGREILTGMVMYVFLSNAFYGIISLTRLSEFFFIFVPISTSLLVESYTFDSNDFVIKTKNTLPLLNRLSDEQFLVYGFSIYYVILTVVTIFIMNGNGVIPYQMIFFK